MNQSMHQTMHCRAGAQPSMQQSMYSRDACQHKNEHAAKHVAEHAGSSALRSMQIMQPSMKYDNTQPCVDSVELTESPPLRHNDPVDRCRLIAAASPSVATKRLKRMVVGIVRMYVCTKLYKEENVPEKNCTLKGLARDGESRHHDSRWQRIHG